MYRRSRKICAWCKCAIKGQCFYIFSFPLLESISLSDKSDKMKKKKKKKKTQKKSSLSEQFQNPIKKIVARGKIDTLNNKTPHIFLDWHSTSLNRLKLVTWAQPSSFHKLVQCQPSVFSGVRVNRSLVLCVCFVDRSRSFLIWPSCCLSFDLRILITPLVS